MENFEGLDLDPTLMRSLESMKYSIPTPIQAQSIPLAIAGRDIMGSAQTGTGKTAAFAIPLVEKLLRSESGSALVMTPTRELGKQIMEIIHQLLGRQSNINTAFIIGGESMGKQFGQLKRHPRIIVGTPGRINDHLERGSMDLSDTDYLVLDETDRMLDMGFSVQLDRIFKYLPEKRQTLMFSATLPDNIVKLSKRYLTNPERVAVGSTTTPMKNIKQEIVHLSQDDKYDELVRQLSEREGSVIVFVKTKFGTERLAKRLKGKNFDAEAIHGDLKQNRRDRVIQGLRNQKYRILVATDVVARGLDIPHIEHVINFDLPQVAEDYIHRIGRTARAGAEGNALCLVSPQDRSKWNAIERLIDPSKKHSHDDKPQRSRGRGGFDGRKKFGDKKSSGGYNKSNNGQRSGGYNKSNDGQRSGGYNKSNDGQRSGGYNKSNDGQRSGGYNKSNDGQRSGGYNKSNDDQRSGGYNKSNDGQRSGGYNKSNDGQRSGGYNKSNDGQRSGGYNKSNDGQRSGGYNKSNDGQRSGGYNKSNDGQRSGGYNKSNDGQRSGGYNKSNDGQRSGGYNKSNDGQRSGGYNKSNDGQRSGGYNKSNDGQRSGGYNKSNDGQRSGGYNKSNDGQRSGGYNKSNDGQRSGGYNKSNDGQRSGGYNKSNDGQRSGGYNKSNDGQRSSGSRYGKPAGGQRSEAQRSEGRKRSGGYARFGNNNQNTSYKKRKEEDAA